MEAARTTRDFVRDLCVRGRNDTQVMAVARNTWWAGKLEEVEDWLARRGEKWRQPQEPEPQPEKIFKFRKKT